MNVRDPYGIMAAALAAGLVGLAHEPMGRQAPRRRTIVSRPSPPLNLAGALDPKPKGKRGKRRAKAKAALSTRPPETHDAG